MKGVPDDRELVARRPSASEQMLGTMFDRAAFPVRRPAARTEQRPLKEARYRQWRETTLGQRAWSWMLRDALDQAHDGARRIGVKSLVERCRDELKVTVNNSWTGFLARDLVDAAPTPLRERIELRVLGSRTAALG